MKYDYPSDDQLVELAKSISSVAGLAVHLGMPRSTLRNYIDSRPELKQRINEVTLPAQQSLNTEAPPVVENEIDAAVHKLIKKRESTVEELADYLDVPPRIIRASVDRLREQGYRVMDTDEESGLVLDKVVPVNIPAQMHKSKALFEGNTVRVGVVSDTHLSSNEEALDELHLAYDVFAEKGITEVWHAGDWTCGRGIFRGQDIEIKNHTFETQVEYLVANYPQRDGIVTRGIAGNHDIEGDFGRIGADPVQALANRRDDIEYLGPYTAWIELPGGSYVHLLHGRGGMSYAFSYKAQKLVESYSSGRKPAALIVGHWHVSGNIEARAVQVVWPGCFEWKGFFLERLGLNPSVGFHIIEMVVGDDGSLVQWNPRWYRVYEGRQLAGEAD